MDSKSVKIKSFAAATFAAALISAQGSDIVAHRGENSQAPENSIPAFEAAFANGAKFIEGDFYLLECGEMICLHGQGELEKLAGIKKPLMKLNKDDLRSIDLASVKFRHLSPVRIPTIAEVFAAIPEGKSIFFEIKNYPKGFFEKLEAERKAAGISEEQISLIAFDFNALKDAKARNPRYKSPRPPMKSRPALNLQTSTESMLHAGVSTKTILARLNPAGCTSLSGP